MVPDGPTNTPGRIRTCNPRFRRPMRYPIVPRVRLPNCSSLDCSVKGARLLPKASQTAFHFPRLPRQTDWGCLPACRRDFWQPTNPRTISRFAGFDCYGRLVQPDGCVPSVWCVPRWERGAGCDGVRPSRDDGQRVDSRVPASGRLISSLSFDFGPVSRFCRMSASVKRAIRISPSVARLRS